MQFSFGRAPLHTSDPIMEASLLWSLPSLSSGGWRDPCWGDCLKPARQGYERAGCRSRDQIGPDFIACNWRRAGQRKGEETQIPFRPAKSGEVTEPRTDFLLLLPGEGGWDAGAGAQIAVAGPSVGSHVLGQTGGPLPSSVGRSSQVCAPVLGACGGGGHPRTTHLESIKVEKAVSPLPPEPQAA